MPCGFWELNLSPLVEQPMLLSTEPSLAYFLFINFLSFCLFIYVYVEFEVCVCLYVCVDAHTCRGLSEVGNKCFPLRHDRSLPKSGEVFFVCLFCWFVCFVFLLQSWQPASPSNPLLPKTFSAGIVDMCRVTPGLLHG